MRWRRQGRQIDFLLNGFVMLSQTGAVAEKLHQQKSSAVPLQTRRFEVKSRKGKKKKNKIHKHLRYHSWSDIGFIIHLMTSTHHTFYYIFTDILVLVRSLAEPVVTVSSDWVCNPPTASPNQHAALSDNALLLIRGHVFPILMSDVNMNRSNRPVSAWFYAPSWCYLIGFLISCTDKKAYLLKQRVYTS